MLVIKCVQLKTKNSKASVATADVLLSGLNLISGPPDFVVASAGRSTHIGLIIGKLPTPAPVRSCLGYFVCIVHQLYAEAVVWMSHDRLADRWRVALPIVCRLHSGNNSE